MRTARIRTEGRGFYHCMSRVIEKRKLLRHKEKKHFSVLMRRVEKFSCIHVLTHSILDNHWHMVIEVPERRNLTDEEFLERLAALYKKELVDDTGSSCMCRAGRRA